MRFSRWVSKNSAFRDENGVGGGEAVELPLYGRIAAGMPIEALRDHANPRAVKTILTVPEKCSRNETCGKSRLVMHRLSYLDPVDLAHAAARSE